MTSKFPDEKSETGDETLHKKRARRVSFAETTAVHFFKRDDESETTPDPVNEDQSSSNGKLRRSESDEILELLRSSSDSDSDGGGGDGDDDVDIMLKSSFLHPMESPSSGSCFGSATSNDEDNFFGPVSAEFIRPGRLSDSAFSDENHEVTMDSTAFSMNFRSLARSDSGGEFKTPTGIRVPFGERTSGQTSTAASLGDSMVLTGDRKLVLHSSLPVDKVNDSGNSDDMSLVGENHRRYDYGELPPELDVLLDEGKKDGDAVSDNVEIEYSNSTRAMNTTNGHALSGHENFNLTDNRDAVSTTTSPKTYVGEENIDIADAILCGTPRCHSNQSTCDRGLTTPSNHIQAILQIHDIPFEKDKEGRIGSEVSGMFESPPSLAQSRLGHELPIAGSISSLLPKRGKIFKDSDGSRKAQSKSPQGDKEFHVKGTINRGWTTSIFAKSVSRLKRLETSFLSASKVEGNASKLGVPGLSLRSTEKVNHFKYSSNDTSLTHVDAPVACLDEQFAECDVQSIRTSGRGNHDLTNIGIVNPATSKKVHKDEEFLALRTISPSPKASAKRPGLSSSTTSLETELVNHKSNDLHESEVESHAIKGSNFSLQDITFYDLKDNGNTRTPDDFACSPGGRVVKEVSTSPLYAGSPSMLNLGHHGQKEPDDLASNVENYSNLHVEKEKISKLSSYGVNNVEDVSEKKLTNQTSFTRDIPVQMMQSLSDSTLSSEFSRNDSQLQVFENPKEDPVFIMMPKETHDLRDDAKKNFSGGQDGVILHKLLGKDNEDVQLLHVSSNIFGSDNPSSRKRKLFVETESHNDHALLPHRESKLCKDQKNYEDLEVLHCVESNSASRDWADVLSSFCDVTKQLLTPVSNKFDMAQIAKLDDTLVHLDKLKSYELLHHEKAFDSARFLSSKRVANTKLLQYRTLYQKAKLQLLCLKRDKLRDQAFRMKSRVDESEKLISSCHHLSKGGETDQIGFLQLQCHSTDPDNRNMVSAQKSLLRKKFEDSIDEIKKSSKSFCSYIKDMNELTSTEIAASVKGLLKKMVACQSLQSELQLCKVERLHAKHGQPNIMFDHGRFMTQSFIPKYTANSALILENRLNKERISKMFIDDIDAYAAFSFVLSGDKQLEYQSSRTIAEQTQKTVSHLHNLLDVIEELQLAMLELKSLTWSRFCQPSAGKLDLQLCFTDFRSGARVALSIDLTSLNHGVYPSQVVPYEVRGTTDRNHERLVADIQTAVGGVGCGFMRIVRICRCVSRMVQAAGMS
ncbi:hypothetical protein RND81_08G092900 [Saponaria officinalis]|uniref:Uncharacterized protein n=1 Tax=Saponaria officinalis TaxID=3572 RepID=A0AAW1J4Q3_SAPOF